MIRINLAQEKAVKTRTRAVSTGPVLAGGASALQSYLLLVVFAGGAEAMAALVPRQRP